MKELGSLFLVLCGGAWATLCPVGYTKDQTVTVNASQVSSGPQTNYVMRIVNVSANFATTGNGGFVTSASGFDIVPANSSGSQMTFDMYRYNAANGNFEMNVLVPSIN